MHTWIVTARTRPHRTGRQQLGKFGDAMPPPGTKKSRAREGPAKAADSTWRRSCPEGNGRKRLPPRGSEAVAFSRPHHRGKRPYRNAAWVMLGMLPAHAPRGHAGPACRRCLSRRGVLRGSSLRSSHSACGGLVWPRLRRAPEHEQRPGRRYRPGLSMIPKSGYRFSEKIMLKQRGGAG
jgi:hypothetical protein